MRSVLLLGGTGWLGRHIADALLRAGADVTCLARGSAPAPSSATMLTRDRDAEDAYDSVRRPWDVVIDMTSTRHHGLNALTTLAAETAHWITVSTVSVYADNDEPGSDETAALVDDGPVGEYAADKAAIERAAIGALGDRLTIVRPGLIVGPGDPSDRFGYWVGRLALAHDEPVLAPDVADARAQIIDVRDLAAWICRTAMMGPAGRVNAVGTSMPLPVVLDAAAEVARYSGRRREVQSEWLIDHGVAYWAGPRSLPLWLPNDMPGFATRSRARFEATGGTERPLTEILQDVLDDERRRGLDRPRRSGLSRADEQELLADLSDAPTFASGTT